MLANPAVVLAALEIEAHRENRAALESPVIQVCLESRIDQESVVQERLDLHNIRWVHIHSHSPLYD
ncbi:hypothetical protein [Peribacillus simplex]|uniref:hypothetical protein n=1 Tax=Peribacillus simplex TaxID=1478 RepID=UPI0021A9DACC|nr:hypothetical protein [Peribacillus simplex]